MNRQVAMGPIAATGVNLEAYLAECRNLAIERIRTFIPQDSAFGPVLYDLMLDYPLRNAKGLRPALCLATSRALGGGEQATIPSAAILELYHNAFLVHDDIEDDSVLRRDRPTLHRVHGLPIAINVGDGMLALALDPLLDNLRLLGLTRALRIMQEIATMSRETAEGQAMELSWISRSNWALSDEDYRCMVVKKTGWYSFIAPVVIGAIIANASAEQLTVLRKFAHELSIAFQIRDDVLNLCSEERRYGKEAYGDLWEGKRTLILIHMLRNATSTERDRAVTILDRPRRMDAPSPLSEDFLSSLEATGHLSRVGRGAVEAALSSSRSKIRAKTAEEINYLFELIQQSGSIGYATKVGQEHAESAARHLEEASAFLHDSLHRDVLHQMIAFTMNRSR